MNFIEVSSEWDYGACTFEDSEWFSKIPEVYKMAVNNGGTCTISIEEDDEQMEIDVKALTFGNVPDDFFEYVMNELCDYDMLKSTNIYKVED